MTSLVLYGFLALGILGALGGIGYKIHDAGYVKAKAACELAAQIQREIELGQANSAATGLEGGNEKARVVYRTITKEVAKIVERSVYRECKLDADGLSGVNAALAGALSPAAEPHKPVPKPDAAR